MASTFSPDHERNGKCGFTVQCGYAGTAYRQQALAKVSNGALPQQAAGGALRSLVPTLGAASLTDSAVVLTKSEVMVELKGNDVCVRVE